MQDTVGSPHCNYPFDKMKMMWTVSIHNDFGVCIIITTNTIIPNITIMICELNNITMTSMTMTMTKHNNIHNQQKQQHLQHINTNKRNNNTNNNNTQPTTNNNQHTTQQKHSRARTRVYVK
jgi:hypothetical protein